VEDVIAEVIKEHKEINQDNIVDIIRHFALRGVTIDRTPDHHTWIFFALIFFDTRTGIQQIIGTQKSNELVAKIPNMREFRKETNTYLKQITIIIIGVAEEIESANSELHGRSVREILENHILPRTQAQDRDNPVYHFEHSDKGRRCIKVFCNPHSRVTHVYDRNAKIILKGASEKTLEDTRDVLDEIGFGNVDIEHCPVRPSIPQRISFQLSLARKELFSLGNFAKFMWALLGAIITFLAQWLLSQIFN